MFEKVVRSFIRAGRQSMPGAFRSSHRPAVRAAAVFLSVCVAFTMTPAPTVAAVPKQEEQTGLCAHHLAHTDECGYQEAKPGHPCEHGHTTNCYTDGYTCGYIVDEDAKASDSDAQHVHTQDCRELDCPHERGEHRGDCGYIEAVAAIPCGYVCVECGEPDKDIKRKWENVLWEGVEEIVLTAFDDLDMEVQYQSVSAGTKLEDLTLPAKLNALGYKASDAETVPEAVTVKGAAWEPDSLWNAEAEQGSYIFIPVLPERYTLADGVKLPEIYVKVGERPVVYGSADDTNNDGYHDGDIEAFKAILQAHSILKVFSGIDENDPASWQTVNWVNWEDNPKRITLLRLANKGLTGTLDVSGLTSLRSLNCYDNQLETLNMSGLTSLSTLNCYNNQLETLDVSGLTSLSSLDCSNNRLETLNVSGLMSLRSLYCNDNQLETLDGSDLTSLSNLDCGNNPISSLKLPGGKQLTVQSAEGGKVELTGYNDNDKSVTLTATANDGYAFKEWAASGAPFATNYLNPVEVVLTGEVTITPVFKNLSDTRSDAKKITEFTIPGQEKNTAIDQNNHTITVTMPNGTDVTSLAPAITVSDKAIVSPQSDVVQDFTNPVTYTVTAENETTQAYTVTVTVRPPSVTAPAIATATLPGGVVGTAYSQTLAANGDAPIAWSIEGGGLPGGLALNSGTGTISGTPTAASTFTFTVKAENQGGSDTKELSIRITDPEPTVTAVSVTPDAVEVQKGGTQQFNASVTGTNGPAQTVSWSLEGSHASGTSISHTGLLTVASDEEQANLTVKATSTVDTSKSGTAAVTVKNPAPSPTYGVSLSQTGTYTFAAATEDYEGQAAHRVTVSNSGNQPTGNLTVALSGANADSFTLSERGLGSIGVDGNASFTVKPNTGLAAGTYTAIVTVTGENGVSGSFGVSFTVNTLTPSGTAPNIITMSMLVGAVGTPYSQALTATGTTPITWSVSEGSLPDGLMLSGNGVISGIPTAAGEFEFIVKAENSVGNATQWYGILIRAPKPTVSSVTVTPITANVQKGGTQQFGATVTGTNDPAHTVTWSIEGDHATGTSISNTGLLTVDANETAATLTVKATSTVDTSKSGTAVATVTNPEPLPTYGISLSQTGTHTFAAATVGYGEQSAHSITVNNSGNQPTGALTVGLSGSNAGSFTLSGTTLDSIAAGGSGSFTVKPDTGLAAGTYTATVTVSGGNDISGSFTVSFTVSPRPASDDATLSALTYTVGSGSATPVPDFAADTTTYNVALPYGTSATARITLIGVLNDSKATITTTEGVTLSGGSGKAAITVTAENGTTSKTYTVNFTTAGDTRSDAKEITAFTISGQVGETVMDQNDHTITVTMPNGTDVTSLTPTITVSSKASVSPQSSVARDFTNSVTYTVTAENETTQTYTVIVNVQPPSDTTPTVSSVTVTPNTVNVQKGSTQQFHATVTGANGPAQTVIWSLVGTHANRTTITADGLLTVDANETEAALTVKATSTADTGKNGTATVTVTNAAPLPVHTITALAGSGGTISPSGAVAVKEGESRTFIITPNSNYRISQVMADDKDQGAVAAYTFENVTANHRISVTFRYIGGSSGGASGGDGGSSSDDGGSSSGSGSPSSGGSSSIPSTTTGTTAGENGTSTTTTRTTSKDSGGKTTTVTTEITKDAVGNATGSATTVTTDNITASTAQGSSTVTVKPDAAAIGGAAKAAGASGTNPMDVSVAVPRDTVKNELQKADVNTVRVEVVIPKAVEDNPAVRTPGVTLEKETVDAARQAGKNVTVTVREETGAVKAVWSLDGQAMGNTAGQSTDLKLGVHTAPVQSGDPIADPVKPPVTAAGQENGLVISLTADGTLLSAAKLTVPATNQTAIAAGSTVALYRFDPNTGAIRAVLGGVYSVDANGNVTIDVPAGTRAGEKETYVLLPVPSTARPAAQPAAAGGGGAVHTVKAGDTLNQISRQYGCRVEDLLALNPGVDIYNLQIGSDLRVR